MPRQSSKRALLNLSDRPFLKFSDMIKVAPDLIRLQSYKTVYSLRLKYVKDPMLRRVFSFHPLLVGGNPFQTTSIYALIHHLERQWGVHYAMGGTGALVAAMGRLFQEIGGCIRLSTPVSGITVENGRATGVTLANGHKMRGRRGGEQRGRSQHVPQNAARRPRAGSTPTPSFARHALTACRCSSSTSALARQYPDIRHHTIILGERYRELLHDIFNAKLLSEDFSLYLHRPSATDPSMAPEGCDCFYALIPVRTKRVESTGTRRLSRSAIA